MTPTADDEPVLSEVTPQNNVSSGNEGNVTLETRTIKYHFGPEFLQLKTLALTLEFYNILDEPIKDLIMFERHWYEDRLLSEFEFKFPFCMPKS